MSAQVDHDLLADYVGGALIGTPESDFVADLIENSRAWRAAAADLTAALQSTAIDLDTLRRAPEPMPDDLADRFDELFASPAFAPTPAAPARDPLASRTLSRPVRAVRRWQKWAAPLAVAAAAFTFFLFVRTPTESQDTTAGGLANVPPAADSFKSTESARGGDTPLPTITSGRQHDRSNLRETVRTTADTAAPTSNLGQPKSDDYMSAASVPELQRLTNPAALQACLAAVALEAPGKPTLIDFSHFEGRPALVISITSPSGRWTFVAGPSCGINGSDKIYSAPL